MTAAEVDYSFSFPALQQLSRELTKPTFRPDPRQQLMLQRALQLLDLELTYQLANQSDLSQSIVDLLTHVID